MKYTVTVMEHTDLTRGCPDAQRRTWHYFTGRTLAQARRICNRHARRGVQRFGGTVEQMNWGVRGGQFPDAYRSATIRLDLGR